MSDPGGIEWLIPLDAWNAAERGGIAWPVVALYDPSGPEVFRCRSRDFADRPDDDGVIDALTKLGLPPVALGPADADCDPVEDDVALRVDAFGPYFRGIRFATMGLSGRLTDAADRAETLAMSAMAASFIDAWKQRRATPVEPG